MTANVYKIDGTQTVWADSGADKVMTLQNLGAGILRQGAVLDLGVGSTARCNRFLLRVNFELETAGTTNDYVDVFLKRGDGTYADNADADGDAASTSAKTINCLKVGSVWVDAAAADVMFSAAWIVTIDERYVAPILWNRCAAVNFQNTANINKVTLTEMPYQAQYS